MDQQSSLVAERRIHPRTLVLGILGLVVVILTAVFVVYYRYTDTWFGRMVGSQFPFPVVLLDKTPIMNSQDLTRDIASIKRFYESQDFSQMGIRVDFSTEEGKKRLKLRERDLLNKTLEDATIERLAKEEGIVITEAEARADVDKRLKEYGATDKVEATIARLYGWTLRDFESKVVLPSLYEEALSKKFESQVSYEASKKQIDEAVKELKKTDNFEEVVNAYSDGRTKANGGDLGWFALEDLAPELRSAVDVAKIGVPTDMVESSLGYHILLVKETKIEENKRLYHLSQVFVRKENFVDWLTEKIRSEPVRVLLSDYHFDKETGRIDFRSQEMKDFEEKLRSNPDQDPLFFY